ncbi:hypothetical protein TNCT_309821 [Trichonephila clavata]|uniref:Uncharacterized protein n=1 Tax=Trichonephila clavata TaxID=2740835 RepID=A0A8X6FP77_TRICU|nr:hypothetical protein TNCT_309821 [Trichonephila clavata]
MQMLLACTSHPGCLTFIFTAFVPEEGEGDICTPRKRKRGIGCGRGVFAKKMEMRMDRDVVRAELGGKASHVIGAWTRGSIFRDPVGDIHTFYRVWGGEGLEGWQAHP